MGVEEDKAALRVIEYLNATISLGLVMCGHEDALGAQVVDVAADSDLGGELDTMRSTGGYDTATAAPRTWIPTEWQGKTGTATARNTADAEL